MARPITMRFVTVGDEIPPTKSSPKRARCDSPLPLPLLPILHPSRAWNVARMSVSLALELVAPCMYGHLSAKCRTTTADPFGRSNDQHQCVLPPE